MADRSHPAMVTSRRLGAHAEKWLDRFTPDELRAISDTRNALRRISYEDADEREVRSDG